jgi:hypothetical protein
MMDEVDEVLGALETLSDVVNTSVEKLLDVQAALLRLMESRQRRTARGATAPERYASPPSSELKNGVQLALMAACSPKSADAR